MRVTERDHEVFQDWRPYDRVPRASLLLFGANPAHMPASEKPDPDSIGQLCPRCEQIVPAQQRPDFVGPPAPTYVDRLRVYGAHVGEYGEMSLDPLLMVCGKCARSLMDATASMDRQTKPGDGEYRPGYERYLESIEADDIEHGTDKTDRLYRTALAVRAAKKKRNERNGQRVGQRSG
jgi:hypothetical protein